MSLAKLLTSHKSAIIRQWFDLVVRTYPPDTQQFLKSQRDPFANPVGQNTLGGLKALFDELLSDVDRVRVVPHLDVIIRIRAVQDFSPSKAVAFILDLKAIVRKVLGDVLHSDALRSDWAAFEHRVDALTLVAFDVYMSCREKIFALKADNERTRVLKTFSRAGLLDEEPET